MQVQVPRVQYRIHSGFQVPGLSTCALPVAWGSVLSLGIVTTWCIIATLRTTTSGTGKTFLLSVPMNSACRRRHVAYVFASLQTYRYCFFDIETDHASMLFQPAMLDRFSTNNHQILDKSDGSSKTIHTFH